MNKEKTQDIMPARIEINGVNYIRIDASYELSAKDILINAMEDKRKTPEELEALASVGTAISKL